MKKVGATEIGWAEAAQALVSGGLVILPTDTVYGLACDPNSPHAINLIYEAKGRVREKALPLLLSGQDQLSRVVRDLPPVAERLAAAFWPGALTLVLPKSPDLPEDLGAAGTIAVRVPARVDLRAFIANCGGAVAATSANRSGEAEATTAEEAIAAVGRWAEVVVDGGPSGGSTPSTVVDCTIVPYKVLRAGAISLEELAMAAEDRG